MRRNWRVFAGALFGVGLVAFLLGAATIAEANQLHQQPPIAWNSTEFGGGDCPDLAPGQVLWHFVHTDTKSTDLPSTLTAKFTTAGTVTVAGFVNGNSVVMYDIITGHDTLLSASDSISNGGLLNLSHICVGPPLPTPSPSPSPSPTPTPTATPTPTPSESPSPSPSESPSPSPSESPSPSPSQSPSPSPSQSPSPSPSESPSPTPSQSPSPTPSTSPSPTPSTSPTPTPTTSPTPVGGGGAPGVTPSPGTGEVLAETGANPPALGLGFGAALVVIGLLGMIAGAVTWMRQRS